MLFYKISDGELLRDEEFMGTGYSGTGLGRNNLSMCSVANIGPIPPGIYSIGLPYTHPVEGPLVMNLTPSDETETFGRSAFHIHGDNARNDASHGCIILGPSIRKEIINSGEKFITVLGE